VDGLTVQIQDARAIARTTQVTDCPLAIVAAPEMQGE